MKALMSLLVGLSLVMSCAAPLFALGKSAEQNAQKKKKKKKKKGMGDARMTNPA
jgi:hypothetical protein